MFSNKHRGPHMGGGGRGNRQSDGESRAPRTNLLLRGTVRSFTMSVTCSNSPIDPKSSQLVVVLSEAPDEEEHELEESLSNCDVFTTAFRGRRAAAGFAASCFVDLGGITRPSCARCLRIFATVSVYSRKASGFFLGTEVSAVSPETTAALLLAIKNWSH